MNWMKTLASFAVVMMVAAALTACTKKEGASPEAGGAGGDDVYEVALFVGSLSAQNAIDRRQGILDELEGKPLPEVPAAPPVTMPAVKVPEGEKAKVAFVTNNASEFWTIARAGFDKALGELPGVEGAFQIPAQGTAAEQKAILEDLVTKQIHGVAVSPVDPTNQTPDLNNIAEKTILICHDSDAPQSKRVLYIGTNNYTAGREAGKLIKEVLGSDKPIKVVDTRTDNTDRSRAKSNVQDTLVSRPGIDCLVGLWSYNGPIIGGVLKETNMAGKVKAVCFDEERGTLQSIREGGIYATVVQKPYEFGYQSVKVLAALAKGDLTVIPPSRVIDTGVTLVKKENVDEFEKWLDGVLGK